MDKSTYVVEVPEIAGTLTIEVAGLFGGPTLFLDGAPAPSGLRRGTFVLPGRDGRERIAKWVPNLLMAVPVLEIDGAKHELGPKIPVILLILAALPMGLVAVGGLVGGLCGGLAFGVNQSIARSTLATPVKVISILAIGSSAVIGFFVFATMLSLAMGR